MPDKILPTRTDAIAVRPESLPTPDGKTERRELRTVNSKTFLHAEKAVDGKEIRTCQAQIGAVCYVSDDGALRSIDTTIRDLGDHIGVEWAPYKFRLHDSGIGFDFESRGGGEVSVLLTEIGGEPFHHDTQIKPDITDNTITFRDVRPGCDIVFKCLNERVKTLRILHDKNAPRTFEWMTQDDILRGRDLIVNELSGTDADGKALTLTCEATQIDRASFRVTETWTGETQDKTPVVYPVEIDPSVTVNPAASGDDGYQVGTNWSTQSGATTMRLGSSLGDPYHIGIRFPNVTVPNAATITTATLGLTAASTSGLGGAGTIYGRAADNPAAFDNTDYPSIVDRTTASTAIAADNTTGAKTWNVTSIAQELVDRVGFASGNAMALAIIGTVVAVVNFTSYSTYDNGSDIPYLEITYTAAGGTAGNLLLLGCG